MIYLITFIYSLFLTQITRALPWACRDPVSPELFTQDPYVDTEYNLIPSPLRVTFDKTFDNAQGSLKSVACSDGENGLASRFPKFGDLPNFPNIGGAFDVSFNSPNCGGCWMITNKANGAIILLTAVDTAAAGFNIAETAFRKLNGGQLGDTLEVEAQKVDPDHCRGGLATRELSTKLYQCPL
jgi:hypothetical protein